MTLWLTRIRLNLRNYLTRAEFADAVKLHKRLMSLLPDQLGEHPRQQAGLLYRIDETRTSTDLLFQTQTEPDLAKLPPNYGGIAQRNLEPLLESLNTGMTVHYRLAGNACKRLPRGSSHPGKLAPLHGHDAEQWWLTRASYCGLQITALTATPQPAITGRRPQAAIRHNVIRYDGTATITNPDALRHTIHSGVGRGKAHGCGLLSLAPRH